MNPCTNDVEFAFYLALFMGFSLGGVLTYAIFSNSPYGIRRVKELEEKLRGKRKKDVETIRKMSKRFFK